VIRVTHDLRKMPFGTPDVNAFPTPNSFHDLSLVMESTVERWVETQERRKSWIGVVPQVGVAQRG